MLRIQFGPGNKAALRCLKETQKRTRHGIESAFKAFGPTLAKAATASMKESKSGRTYRVYWSVTGQRLQKGRTHQASSKSETPAIVSGRLMRSLNFKVKGFKSLVFGANGIDPDSGFDYGRKHELSPRSYLKRTINSEDRNIQADFVRALEAELTRGMKR